MRHTEIHLLPAVVFLILTLSLTPQISKAQWSLGVSYELRDEEPKNGFGARLEREILTPFPSINIALKAHFSFFTEERLTTVNGIETGRFDFETYDVGVSGLLIFNIGLLRPYAGIGIGLDNTSIESFSLPESQDNSVREDIKSLDAYLLATAGAYIDVFPFLSPFIDFRFTQLSGRDEFDYNSYNRVSAGISLRF